MACLRPPRAGSAAARVALLVLAVTLSAPALPGCLAPAAHAEVRLPPHGDRSVIDLASVIEPADAARMEQWHRALLDGTGVALVVVTVPELDGEAIEDFATRAGTEWGVGKKGQDKGLVVALAVKERRVFVATGYGVEEYLPDARVGALLDAEAMPDLRASRFSRGLLHASAALTSITAQRHGLTIDDLPARRSPARTRGGKPSALKLILALVGMAILFYAARRNPLLLAILLSGRGRRGGAGGFGGGYGGGGFSGGGFGGFGGGSFGGGGAGRGF